MNNSERYYEYKLDLMNYLNNILDCHSKEIIDSFVEYYGEQHRGTITNVYERIIFIFWNTPDAINDYINEKIEKKSKELTDQCLNDMGFDTEKSDWYRLRNTKKALFGISKEYDMGRNLSSDFNDIPILNENRKKTFNKLRKSKYTLFPFTTSKKENLKLFDRYLEIIKLYSNKLKEYEEKLKEEEEYKIRFLSDERKIFDKEDELELLKNISHNELISIYNPHSYAITTDHLVNYFKDYINEQKTMGCAGTYLYNKEECYLINMVLIKLYFADDETIIHEINHCISKTILGCLNEDILIIGGYFIGNETNELINKFDEEITDKISIEITKILHSKGIYILNKKFDYEALSWVSPKINSLFDSFGKYINEGYITINKNAFIQRIGKENFTEFLSTLNETDYGGKKTEELIRKMKKVCKS